MRRPNPLPPVAPPPDDPNEFSSPSDFATQVGIGAAGPVENAIFRRGSRIYGIGESRVIQPQ